MAAIAVKLGGELKRHGGRRQHIEAEASITVAEAMKRLGVDEDPEAVLVIVNGEVVPPASRGSHTLADGDELSLMPQLKGG